jgi:hypothetical protein
MRSSVIEYNNFHKRSQRRNTTFLAHDTFVTFVLVPGSGWVHCAAAAQLA